MPDYFVDILTNRSGTLYTGMTNDLARRLVEHRGKAATPGSFTSRSQEAALKVIRIYA
jgi:putative endonuclease